jgi:hypothetical protein
MPADVVPSSIAVTFVGLLGNWPLPLSITLRNAIMVFAVNIAVLATSTEGRTETLL